MKVKKELHEMKIVGTVTYKSELWSMRMMEMNCLGSKICMTRRDKIRNEVVCSRTSVMIEIAAGRIDGWVL